jgi:hypothetical protein
MQLHAISEKILTAEKRFQSIFVNNPVGQPWIDSWYLCHLGEYLNTAAPEIVS